MDNLYPHEYVAVAYANGITTGKTASTFAPYDDISRAQVISMVIRSVENYIGFTFEPVPPSYYQTGYLAGYEDATHGYNVHLAEYSGLLDGIPLAGWDPWATADRGEVAQILWNMREAFVEEPVTDVYVYPDGSGDYPTLEAAVTDVGPGTTIHLSPGTFQLARQVVIERSVTLAGAGMTQTVVSWSGEGAALSVRDAAEVGVDGIHFSHQGSQASNTVVVDGAEVGFSDCRFTGGVHKDPANEGGSGLYVMGASTVEVVDCKADGNDMGGVEVYGSSSAAISRTDCSGNDDGVLFWEDSSGTVEDCTCRDNVFSGVGAYDRADVAVRGSTCAGNGDGISFFDQSGGSASGNTCSGNEYGIYVGDDATPTIGQNLLIDNLTDYYDWRGRP